MKDKIQRELKKMNSNAKVFANKHNRLSFQKERERETLYYVETEKERISQAAQCTHTLHTLKEEQFVLEQIVACMKTDRKNMCTNTIHTTNANTHTDTYSYTCLV